MVDKTKPDFLLYYLLSIWSGHSLLNYMHLFVLRTCSVWNFVNFCYGIPYSVFRRVRVELLLLSVIRLDNYAHTGKYSVEKAFVW